MFLLPKATPRVAGQPFQAQPQGFRPISLSNAFQKLLSKAVNVMLEKVAAEVVHPAQTGFIRGRRVGDNVLRSDGSHGCRRGGVALCHPLRH